MSLKKVVRRLLGKLGYRVINERRWMAVPVDDYIPKEKYISLIEHCYELYKQEKLQQLAPMTRERGILLSRLIGTELVQALFILDAMQRTKDLQGDVCEFGVAQGATSALLANEILDSDKALWLFDSFTGLPKPSAEDQLQNDIFGLGSMAAYEGAMACPESMVSSRLMEVRFPVERTHIVAGFLEKSLDGPMLPRKVSFAFVDLDLYLPIRQALEFLDNRLAVGGVVAVHDYGYFSTGAKRAVDGFIAERQKSYRAEFPQAVGTMCFINKYAQS